MVYLTSTLLSFAVFAACVFPTLVAAGDKYRQPDIPSSVETVDEIVMLAELHANGAIAYAAGNYGGIELMNDLIETLNTTESDLLVLCQGVDGTTNETLATCEQSVSDILWKARDDVATMRDIDIETDIVILFAQYWRPNACMGGRSYGAPAYGRDECFNVEKNSTIHGIWPSSGNISAFPNPVNCSDPHDLTKEDIGDLGAQLNESWVSYYPIWNNFQFWQWEWYKHGSCWNRTKQEFLQQALEWHNEFDIPKIMQDEGIELGVQVNQDETLQKLTDKMWGKRLGILCMEGGVEVDQIFACFDWSGTKPIDCQPTTMCRDQVNFTVYNAQPSTDEDQPSAAKVKATSAAFYILFASILFSCLLSSRM